MGLSASQGRLLLLTAKQNDLEFQAQQISQKRLILSQQLEQISKDYEEATNDRQMKIHLYAQTNDENGNKSTRDVNLTYAYLVSAAANNAGWNSGIQASEKVGTVDMEYSTDTVAFRLVDVSGAIVVSDLSEIPSKVYESGKKDKSESATTGTDNLYKVSQQTSATADPTNSYFVTAQGDLATALSTHRKGTGTEENKTIKPEAEYDSGHGWVKFNNEVYDIKTGNKITGDTANTFSTKNNEKVTLVSSDQVSEIPKTISYSDAKPTTLTEPKQGADGKYTVYREDGTVYQTYVVDPSLRSGSTDADGNTSSGPNYIQDSIRNGKYLLQKHRTETENNNKNTWNNVSWDAITTISDQYYTENDNTAKAKYDRLQGEIERQDKKLELELDNIESERNAVKTEIESVNKVINDNISASFKYFDA